MAKKVTKKLVADSNLRWTATLGSITRYVSANGTLVNATTVLNCKQAGIDLSGVTEKKVAVCTISIDSRGVNFKGLSISAIDALKTAMECAVNAIPIPQECKEKCPIGITFTPLEMYDPVTVTYSDGSSITLRSEIVNSYYEIRSNAPKSTKKVGYRITHIKDWSVSRRSSSELSVGCQYLPLQSMTSFFSKVTTALKYLQEELDADVNSTDDVKEEA